MAEDRAPGAHALARGWAFSDIIGTSVGVKLTVTDTAAPAGTYNRVYQNPKGHTFTTITDTSSFATCP